MREVLLLDRGYSSGRCNVTATYIDQLELFELWFFQHKSLRKRFSVGVSSSTPNSTLSYLKGGLHVLTSGFQTVVLVSLFITHPALYVSVWIRARCTGRHWTTSFSWSCWTALAVCAIMWVDDLFIWICDGLSLPPSYSILPNRTWYSCAILKIASSKIACLKRVLCGN